MSRWLRVSLVIAVIVGAVIGAVIAPMYGTPNGMPSVGDYQSGLIAACTGAATFVLVYWIREPWWRDWVGRFIMSHALVIGLLCVPFIMALFFKLSSGDSRFAAWSLLAIFYLDAAILFLGTILWLHISMQRARERREAEQHEGPEPGDSGPSDEEITSPR